MLLHGKGKTMMTATKAQNFADWIATFSDRSLEQMWVKYCAPQETDQPVNPIDAHKAYLVWEEMGERGLHA